MFSIFQRKENNKMKNSGKDAAISAKDLLDVTEEGSEAEVNTSLSLHPAWNLPMEQQYVFRFLHNELSPLQPNQISIAGTDLEKGASGIEVTAFVRNSLNKKITFGSTPLLLLDENQNLIARQVFNMEEIGELPEKSSRPWVFHFPKETIQQDEFNEENWTLAFEINKPHSLDLHESWQQALPKEQIDKLQQVVESIGAPNKGEVNFMGLQAQYLEDGGLSVTILIRNGTEQNMHLEHLPLTVQDADGEVIAEGGFALSDFAVLSNTTKPWTFQFPESLVRKKDADLSKWSIVVSGA
ncbi:accessory Sec system S-layer assembly protein [Bacillus infantis]|uniref:accessory Sec system S-layer assembly protein n=1 Tax=Bacillus infantis TaxID=324767 RepID=UPI001CD31690|nr:accessory Sec system S-layer assembly protein [Bacillus infantis]MCA1040500.1 accessory Sec system S-layer assembly protein [Bacillus infantis]